MRMPQIVTETGVSADYWNEYFGKTYSFNRGGLSEVAEGCREYPVKKYEERFSPVDYEGLITPQNEGRIKRLNDLADLVNRTFVDVSAFTEVDFKRVINEVHNLIYGKGEAAFYPEVNR